MQISAVGIVGDNCGARPPPWTIVRILSNACSHVHLCVNVYCACLAGAETFLSTLACPKILKYDRFGSNSSQPTLGSPLDLGDPWQPVLINNLDGN